MSNWMDIETEYESALSLDLDRRKTGEFSAVITRAIAAEDESLDHGIEAQGS